MRYARACVRARGRTLIDPTDSTIRALVQQGYRAAHVYLRSGDRVNYTFVAKHGETGKVVQGWSGGGDAADALRDLGRWAE